MEALLQDLRYTFRSFKHNPVFVSVAALTLALGIGANTAVFSVVNGVLLRPLPYEDPDRLALIWTNFGADLPQNWVSGPEYAEMQEFATLFDAIAVVAPTTVSFTGLGEPEQIDAAAASGTFFRVMRVRPLYGRLIGPDDDTPASNPVAVLGHGFWRRRFGADPAMVGQTITANGTTYTVIGVLPPGFAVRHPDAQFPDAIDVWVPMVPVFGTTYPELNRGSHFLRAFGRLADDVSLEQAQTDMDRVALQIQEQSPDYYDFPGWGVTVLSLHADLVEDVRPALLILLGAVGFVLLIACVNVANLQLTRAAGREREIAVRTAIGADRTRLVRQLLTESVVLALVGGLLGLVLAFGLIRVVMAVAPSDLPLRDVVGVDGSVLWYTLAIALVTGVLFGLAPVVYGMRQSIVGSLKEGGRGATSGVGGRRVRTALVVAEVALALVLLVGAGLMIRSLDNLLRANPGYRTDNLLTMRIALPSSRYDGPAQQAFYSQLLERVRALPGVSQAGAISHLPLSGSYTSGTTRVNESRTVTPVHGAQHPFIEADRRWVTPEYFETMGVQLLQGRTFNAFDGSAAPLVAMVDEEFVRRFWPTEEPIGKRVAINRNDEGELIWREVIGVVRHSKHYDLSTVGREQVYFPHPQFPVGTMYLAVRTASDPVALTSSIRGEVWALDSDQPVSDVQTMRDRVGSAVAQPRFNLLLLVTFAGIALLLATVGIYGVISYSVGQRTHEIGVRMALGASRQNVRFLVFRQGMLLTLIGVGVGLLAAFGLSRLLTALLYGVSPADPVTYGGVAVLLSAVAAAACLLPAGRATRVEPLAVLRDE